MIRASSLFPSISFAHWGAEIVTPVVKIARALANRFAVRELSQFDERMLKDIGLTRSDVVSALDVGLSEDPSVRLRRLAAGRGRI
jgi:uncharacterized protein YjiS (DUF1127 family)